MKPVFRGEAMGRVEAEAMAAMGLDAGVAMEVAGAAVARRAAELADGDVLLLVGPGNNGGDALVAGRYLALAGRRVSAWLPHGARSPAARTNLERFRQAGGTVLENVVCPGPGGVVVDGLFGSGANRPLDEATAAAVTWANGRPCRRLAIDIPSGADPNSGAVPGPAFRADRTVALGALKPPHIFPPARAFAGEVVLEPLGFPLPTPDLWWVEACDLAPPPWRPWDSKHERGRVRVVAGSDRFPGAAVLAAAGALAAGAGYVEVALPERWHGLLLAHLPEVIVRERDTVWTDLERVDALVVGPGLGRDGATLDLTHRALESGRPVVLDADALWALAELPPVRLRPDVVLTPHQGEWERLLGAAALGAPPLPARPLADRGATVIQKGPTSVVLSPGQVPKAIAAGTSVLAQGGSGDVLAGAVGTLLASGLEPAAAALLAVALHGRAAAEASRDMGPVGAGALAVARRLPAAWRGIWP
jgi:hydroxyethylthiazole kinase-like uncharacterized protein yjeF